MSDYWICRHQKWRGLLRAVGNQSISESGNQADYLAKKSILGEVTSCIVQGRDPTDLLVWDAGSGSGFLTEYLVEEGFQVFASDVSTDALQVLQERFPGVSTKVGALHETAWGKTFDGVFCLDVLYHILDDRMWEQSVESMARQGKTLVFLEHLTEEACKPNVHIRFRTLKMYLDLMSQLGVEKLYQKKYTLPVSKSELDLLVFRKGDDG